MKHTAFIVGAGRGLSASLARLLAAEGFDVALAARDIGKLQALCTQTGAFALECDATDAHQVEQTFAALDAKWKSLDLVVYNASARARGPFAELRAADVERALAVGAFGGFLVAQAAAKRMLSRGSGAIFLTGASASLKGYPESAPFAMSKFALRGLAQSMARELAPKNIHIAHFVIDGGIRAAADDPRAAGRAEDALLLPDEIARSYLAVYHQHRSAWSWELELRPWVEKF